ncbi:gamma-glutamyltransferase [Aquisediminimonas sediminicola]|uniref:gamma-glutamyltransferase n=1 Tax=Alteraquisediminimonas sediminicola TaxID=2676787 RepID=UPI001FE7295F|nr:gamma-glutamyltransferase [Aquisediminimonas sediminicola]
MRILLPMMLAFTATLPLVPAIAAAPPQTQTLEKGIVSSANIHGSEAGQEMLRAGGSAADAAMAMMLALTVVEPQSSGIGGGGFLLYHDGRTNTLSTIDGRETAPATARPDRFMGPDGKPLAFMAAMPGGKSVGVPGNIALMAMTHHKWGKLPWKHLFAPAIRLAEQGYQVTPILRQRLDMMAKIWVDFPEAQAIYWRDGQPLPVGATVRNPALGIFLRKLAKAGPKAFYTGDNAKAIIAATASAKRNPAPVTAKDIAGYKAKERPPVCVTYRTYKLCGMGPPSSGATTVFGILGMLEHFPIPALGKDSPTSWHLISEAMRLAYADRDLYLGDADFVSVPVKGLLDPAYLAQRAALISQDAARADYPAGNPPGSAPRTAALAPDVPGTTHFVAADKWGDVASMTSTVEGPFGSALIVNGYFLNNELTDFTFAPELNGRPVANRVEPGKRPMSAMSPTIVYDPQGKVVLAVGSAGGKRIIMHVLKALVGVIDWKLPINDAIALPNIFMAGDAVQIESGTELAARERELARKGRTILSTPLDSKLNAIEFNQSHWRGAADPRSEGKALKE